MARYLVTLGHFSAQMAHDLKNPLVAIRGAACSWSRKRRGADRSTSTLPRGADPRADGSTGAGRERLPAHRARRSGARPHLDRHAGRGDRGARAARSDVAIVVRVAEDVGSPELDRDLIAGALENLAKNAAEAKSKTVEIGAARRGKGRLSLWVKDDGAGMDARVRERAFDEFYTTKATLTGCLRSWAGSPRPTAAARAFCSRWAPAPASRWTCRYDAMT